MKIFEKDELKILWPFYLEAFLGTALWVLTPFMVLYFSSIGLNSFRIGILLAIWPLASIIFEIPTGAIADIYGRKFSVILGWAVQGIFMFLIILSNNFYYLILIMFLMGISQTFVSGALDAWTVDLLKKESKKELIKNYFAHRQSLCNLGFLIAGIIGAFLVSKTGIESVWIISGASLFISIFFLSFGKSEIAQNNQKQKTEKLSDYYLNILNQTKKSIKYSYKHPVLYYLMIISFIFAIASVLQNFISWTPLLKSLGFSDAGFGYLWSLSAIFGIFTPLLAKKLLKTHPEKKILLYTISLIIIQSILMIAANTLYLALALIILLYAIIDFELPINNTFFHKHTPNKLRATIGSINSMLISIATIITLPIAGFLVDKIGPKYTILISGIILIPNIVLYLKIKD